MHPSLFKWVWFSGWKQTLLSDRNGWIFHRNISTITICPTQRFASASTRPAPRRTAIPKNRRRHLTSQPQILPIFRRSFKTYGNTLPQIQLQLPGIWFGKICPNKAVRIARRNRNIICCTTRSVAARWMAANRNRFTLSKMLTLCTWTKIKTVNRYSKT